MPVENRLKSDLDDEKEDAKRVLLIISIALLALSMLLLYTIFCFWPTPSPTGTTPPTVNVSWFGLSFGVRHEQLALLLVLLSGALGGTLGRVSRISHIRTLPEKVPAIYTYITMPFIGAMLALITYLIFQAGLAPTSQSRYIDPYQISGISALTGLFAEEASRKLESFFVKWGLKRTETVKKPGRASGASTPSSSSGQSSG